MKLTEVCFENPTELPDGSSGRMIRALVPADADDKRWLTIDREGDTITVRAHLPGNQYSGQPVDFERDYNWARVSWATPDRARVAAPAPKR